MDDGVITDDLKTELEKCLRIRAEWASAITVAREKESIAKQYGRFEYALRYGPEGQEQRAYVAYANTWLATFEESMTDADRNVYAIYKANGGPPVAEPDEGVHVKRWRTQQA